MKKYYLLVLILLLFTGTTYAQDEQFVGEIRIFGGNYAPKGWMKCEGQILAIQTNQYLFSLLGTTYGGNGTTNFALPDLRDRMAIGVSQTNYPLSQVNLGQVNPGNNTIKTVNLPPHTHSATIKASSSVGNSKVPSTAVSIAAPIQNFNNSERNINYYNSSAKDVTLPVTSLSVSTAGAGSPVALQPFLSTNYCIAVQGIYPSRN